MSAPEGIVRRGQSLLSRRSAGVTRGGVCRLPLGGAPLLLLLGCLALVVAGAGPVGPAAAQVLGSGSQPDRSSPAALSIVVTPSTLLLDQQIVTIDGTGFPADATVYVLECLTGQGLPGCDQTVLAAVSADVNGTFSTTAKVTRLLKVGGTTTDCAVVGACVLGAGLPPDGTTYAAADIQFDPTQPLPPEPSITAAPDTGLVDRQLVTVTGSAFVTDQAAVFQCVAGATNPGGCSTLAAVLVDVDQSGGFQAEIRVRRLLSVPYGEVDCAVPDACVLAAAPVPGIFVLFTTPIVFDPAGPLPTPPTAAVEPRTELVDGQQVVVTASGFDPNIELGIVQCVMGGPPEGAGCDIRGLVEVRSDEQGDARSAFAVRAVLSTELGQIDCTTGPGACIVVVVSLRDLATNVQVPISFGSPPSAEAAVETAPTFTG